MNITLSNVTLEAATTAFREQLDEIGGRDAREIAVSGLVIGWSKVEDIENRLDEIINAASEESFSAELSIRPGRVLFVRRKAFAREVLRDEPIGAFSLVLEARDPYEWSALATILPWTIGSDPAELLVTTVGNVDALPVITLTPQSVLTQPAVSDGTRTLVYDGVIAPGQSLLLDSGQARLMLDGQDVTPYMTGEFPRIPPEGATLTFSDADAAAPSVDGEVRYRDRWW